MNEILIVGILAGLNVFQFIFWARQVQELVNKLMCRNLAEYTAIKSGPVEIIPKPEDPDLILEEEEILNELNGQLRGA